MSRQTEARVLLACRHVQTYDPRPEMGDQVYCRLCATWRIALLNAIEWHIKCLTSRCKVGRYYGEDKHGAMRACVSHLGRFPSHTMMARYGDEEGEIITATQAALISLQNCDPENSPNRA